MTIRASIEEKKKKGTIRKDRIATLLSYDPLVKIPKPAFTLNKDGHISVTKTETDKGNESFAVRGHVHGLGGGFATGKFFGAITKIGGYAGIGIACFFHPDTLFHAEELRHAVDTAALASRHGLTGRQTREPRGILRLL